jgi:hypothetical protein
MTAVAEAPQPGSEAVASPQSAVIGIIAGDGVQIGVLLDASAPVSVMIDPLLKVVNSRLRELGLAALEAKPRGRWALCLVDGAPLRATQSLTEQDVYDGDRLWLRFVEDNEHRSQVIEHISTAVSMNLSKRFTAIDPVVAIQVGAAMMAGGVLVASALLWWWRWRSDSWLSAIYAAVAAVLVLTVATMILMRAKTESNRRAGDILLWSGLAPLAVTAAAAARSGGFATCGDGFRGDWCRRDADNPNDRPSAERRHRHRHYLRRGDGSQPGPDGAGQRCGDIADLCIAGLRVRLSECADDVALAVRYPVAGVPVCH